MISKLLVIILSTALLSHGCASRQELSKEIIKARYSEKEGDSRVYPVTEVEAWYLTEMIFRWEKTDEIEEHRDEGYVIVGTGMKMVAFGSVMGVWIEPVDSRYTMVTVVTRRRVSDSFTKLTATRFFERFDQGVKILNEGKELPVVPPE